MSDFLATLASRVRPAAPPIEPRRSSIFESPSRETAPAEVTTEHIATPVVPRPSAYSPVSTETPQRLPPHPQPAPVVASEKPPAAVAPQAVPISSPLATAPAFLPIPIVSADKRPTEQPSEKIHPLPASNQPAPPSPAVTSTHRVITEKVIPLPSIASPVVPTQTAPYQTPPPAQAKPLLTPPAVRLIEPAHQAAAHAARESTSAGQPPVVRVTIGRVEVRAVVPSTLQPSPTAPAKKPGPVISLDDYLAQQSARPARA